MDVNSSPNVCAWSLCILHLAVMGWSSKMSTTALAVVADGGRNCPIETDISSRTIVHLFVCMLRTRLELVVYYLLR
jgi:hypothetical protein